MAQTNFTPILLYASSTPTNVPSAGNLTNSATGSEIAINIADKNLFFKDSTNAVNTVPIRQSSTSSNGWLSATDWNTFNGKAPATSGTSILYGNGSGGFSNVTIGSGISFAGGTLSATGSGGTVTSVSGTGTVNGLTLTGTVTTSGSLTLGGTLNLSSPPVIGNTTPAAITGTVITANTQFVSENYYAQSILGGNLRTSGGTSLLNWDGGGSGNVTVNGGLLANPVNKNVSLAPTGTGSVTINPATAGTINNMVIGGTTPLAITGTTITATTFVGSGASLTGVVTSVTGTSPVVSSGGTTPAISMPAATTSVSGYLTSTDWNTFNNKGSGTVTSVSGTTGRITSTGGTTPVIDLASGVATAGTTGSSTLIPVVTIDTYGRVTSITTASNPQGTVTSVTGTAPVVSSGGATPAISMAAATGSVNGYLTSTDWTTFNNKGSGTVTSVAALTLGTTGTDLSSTVATGTTTPVITLNVPTASATNRGALSSTDWSTFNGKAPGVTFTTGYIPFGQGTTTLNQSAGLQFDGTNFTTTGYATATSFRPSSATVPTNGMYLPVANSVGIATASTLRFTIDASGNAGLGVTPSAWVAYKALQVASTGGALSSSSSSDFEITTNAYYSGGWNSQGAGVASSRYRLYAGTHTWYSAPSAAAGVGITFTQSALVNSFGLGLGTATPSSGIGITFPATQSASSDVNTLDDYEEGTWTPSLVGSTTNPTVTYAGRGGQYTKVGNIVNWTLWIGLSAISGGSGTLQISGFPFTNVNSGSTGYSMSNGWYNDGVTGASVTQTYPVQYIAPNSTTMTLAVGSSGIGAWGITALSVSNVTGAFEVRISGAYQATS